MRPDVTVTGGKNVSVGYRSGSAGSDGTDGLGWTSGDGEPTVALPDGSFYLDEITDNYYKRELGAWVSRGNLKGQPGSGGGGGELQFATLYNFDGSRDIVGSSSRLEVTSASANVGAYVSLEDVDGTPTARLTVNHINPWDLPIPLNAALSPYDSPEYDFAIFVVDASAGPVTINLPDRSDSTCSNGFVFLALWGDVFINVPPGASIDGQDYTHGPFRVMRQRVANGLGDSKKGSVHIGKPYYANNNAWTVLSGAVSAAGTIPDPGGGASFDPRQLIVLAMEGGPFEGFPTAYREITYSGGYVRKITWYVDSTKAAKIVEGALTYTGVNATGEVWKAYAADGVTVLATATDTVTFSGAYEVSRTRVVA